MSRRPRCRRGAVNGFRPRSNGSLTSGCQVHKPQNPRMRSPVDNSQLTEIFVQGSPVRALHGGHVPEFPRRQGPWAIRQPTRRHGLPFRVLGAPLPPHAGIRRSFILGLPPGVVRFVHGRPAGERRPDKLGYPLVPTRVSLRGSSQPCRQQLTGPEHARQLNGVRG